MRGYCDNCEEWEQVIFRDGVPSCVECGNVVEVTDEDDWTGCTEWEEG